MLFNSYSFLFAFLPVVFAGYFVLGRFNRELAAGWMGLSSLVFYGYWNLLYVPLLLISILLNYFFACKLAKLSEGQYERPRRHLLALALLFNLVLLIYFKYTGFLIENLNILLRFIHEPLINGFNPALPIGISFYTFTQMAFLLDCSRRKVSERNLPHYLLFVSYFPHLLNGPFLHHRQMMSQFADRDSYRLNPAWISSGLALLTIGLSKKLLIADPMGTCAGLLFDNLHNGMLPRFFLSWFGILSFTLQIYFDFSGYTDMAVGISLLFGIVLPVNFASPYKATSIINYWQRWHMSLTAYIREYIYNPISLSCTRFADDQGPIKASLYSLFIPTLTTFFIVGLWHGAGWTYIVWGMAHGVFLILNHLWNDFCTSRHSNAKLGKSGKTKSFGENVFPWTLTFVSVCIANVLFRAETLHDAKLILFGMFGASGLSLPASLHSAFPGITGIGFDGWLQGVGGNESYIFTLINWLLAVTVIVFLPDASNWIPLSKTLPAKVKLEGRIGVLLGFLFGLCILHLDQFSPFLYFKF